MQDCADVVVIGAGVIGCSVAYHLAKHGVANVAVVEMGQVGSGSSSKSASMLTLQYCWDEPTARMALYSYARFMDFEDEIGSPIDFQKIGWLNVASGEAASGLRDQALMLRSFGIPTDMLGPREVKARYPEVRTDDLELATFGPDDGVFDAHMIMWGYMRRAQAMGVRLHQGVKATGLRVERSEISAVETTAGDIATKMAVNAAGPWAGEVGQWAGLDIPIRNLKRTVVVTGPFAGFPSTRPLITDLNMEWYCRPEGPGVLMGMGAEPTDDLEPKTGFEDIARVVESAGRRVPVLAEASMLTAWTGIRPMTPDDLPILGPVAAVQGLFLNCGWDGVGIIQAPFAGQVTAEHIVTGNTPTMDIRPFRLERFSEPSGWVSRR